MQEAVTAKEVQLTSYDDNVVHVKSGSGNNKKNNNNNRNRNCTLDPNDPCPIHGGSHKWCQCFDNKFSKNYCVPKGYVQERKKIIIGMHQEKWVQGSHSSGTISTSPS